MVADVDTVRVDLGRRAYDIQIGAGLLARVAEFIGSRCRLTSAVIVTDEHVVTRYADPVAAELRRAGARVHVATLPAGEAVKSVDSANRLWQELLGNQADRATVLLAVGGGVVGDLAGFVAATFARGLKFFQVPTTLLAHVDSSVGGKVAVNLPGAKNMVGTIHQPTGVLIDTDTLHTLPEREYRAGLAEVVKYGVILDAKFFDWLEQSIAAIQVRDPGALRHIIARCCRLKADVVEHDELDENGLRAVLNYGHTFGHALEAEQGYGEYLHGEAVAIGMGCAARLARRLGRIDVSLEQRQTALLAALGLPTDLPKVDGRALVERMRHDKKVAHGRLRFVLPSRLGSVELVENVPEAEVRAVLGD